MKLYNILFDYMGDYYSIQVVTEIDLDDTLATIKVIEYLELDCGYDDIDSDEMEIIELYTITEVNGYKVKLVKA